MPTTKGCCRNPQCPVEDPQEHCYARRRSAIAVDIWVAVAVNHVWHHKWFGELERGHRSDGSYGAPLAWGGPEVLLG